MKFKGQIELDNGYIMVMDFLALSEFEKLSGKKAFEALEELEKSPTVTDLINFHYAVLKRYQPEITLEEAADIMGEYPDALADVMKAASPDVKAASPEVNEKPSPRAGAKKKAN